MPRPSSLVWLRPLAFAATLVVGVLYFSYPSADYLYKAGSFSLARPLYLISAVMGNDKAQHQLASMHMKAQGGPYNPSAAASWYARAAGQGNGLSATALGDIYLKGVGVDADPVKAVALFEQDHRNAAPAELPRQRQADRRGKFCQFCHGVNLRLKPLFGRDSQPVYGSKLSSYHATKKYPIKNNIL